MTHLDKIYQKNLVESIVNRDIDSYKKVLVEMFKQQRKLLIESTVNEIRSSLNG